MTTGSMTQGEWMARNLERMAKVLVQVHTDLPGISTTEQKERITLRLEGVALELSIAEEFSGLPADGSKQIYESIREMLEAQIDRLGEPIDFISREEIARVISIEAQRLDPDMARAERERGSKISLDPDTAQMTLFEAFQT